MTSDLSEQECQKSELCTFLVIAFGATFFLEIAGIGIYGSKVLESKIPSVAMFIPAITAILCLFYFKSTALTKETKLFLTCFLVTSGIIIFELSFFPILGTSGFFPVLSVVASIGCLTLVVILNLRKTWRTNLAAAKLSFGKNLPLYLALSVVFLLVYIIALLLSHYLGLSLPLTEFNLNIFFSTLGISLVTLVMAWPIYFGEEYGWRFYLQDRLFALFGRYTGVVLVGLVWGLWHGPLMLMGMNFPGEPFVPATLLYLAYTIVMSVILAYAVLKTGSIWIAVLLHALTDTVVNTGRAYLSGINTIVSFLPVLVLLGVLALVLLRSPTWTNEKSDRENDPVTG